MNRLNERLTHVIQMSQHEKKNKNRVDNGAKKSLICVKSLHNKHVPRMCGTCASQRTKKKSTPKNVWVHAHRYQTYTIIASFPIKWQIKRINFDCYLNSVI